jgi:hypothetical protein
MDIETLNLHLKLNSKCGEGKHRASLNGSHTKNTDGDYITWIQAERGI